MISLTVGGLAGLYYGFDKGWARSESSAERKLSVAVTERDRYKVERDELKSEVRSLSEKLTNSAAQNSDLAEKLRQAETLLEQDDNTVSRLEQYVQSCEAEVRETKDRLSELPRYLRSGLSEGTQRSWENPDHIALTEEIKNIESRCNEARTRLLSEY